MRRPRPGRVTRALAILAIVGGAVAATRDARAQPAIVAVEPARDGARLAADVRTERLPGPRIVASLDSGLPSAIEMRLELRDDRNRKIGGTSVVFRVAYDLWDEVFRVEGGGADERFADLSSLQRFLGSLPRLPVAPFASMNAATRHRIRVACRLHPIAPRETERLERWVAGTSDREESAEGREVSVGLGDVIRFFYKGAQRDEDDAAEKFSPWFVPGELPAEGLGAGPPSADATEGAGA